MTVQSHTPEPFGATPPNAWPPPTQSQPTPPARQQWARLATPLIILAFVVTLVGATTLRPPQPVPVSGAEEFVAIDGHHEILAGPETITRNTARMPGGTSFLDGNYFLLFVVQHVDDVNARYWVVETERTADAERQDLLELSVDGLSLHLEQTEAGVQQFVPARPELPADPHIGQELTSHGTLTSYPPGETVGTDHWYSSTLRIQDGSAAGEGCLLIERSDQVDGGDAETSSRVRCPERGVVEVRRGAAQWVAVDTWPAGEDPRVGITTTPREPAPLQKFVPHPLEIYRPGSSLPHTIPAWAPWAAVGDILAAGSHSSGNVSLIRREGDRLTVDRVVHPGGSVTSVTGCGEVLVATTSQKTVVAYDRTGQWLWSWPLDDLSTVVPQQLGNHLLVSTRDSALTSLDCATGHIAWQRPEVAGDVAVVPTSRGIVVSGDRTVRLLDPTNGQTIWARSQEFTVQGMTATEDSVVLVDDGAWIESYALANGTPEWRRKLPDDFQQVHPVGEVLVGRGSEQLIAFSRSGTRLWAVDAFTEASVADSDHLFAVGKLETLLIAADGTTIRTPFEMNTISASTFLTRWGGGVLVQDGLGATISWEPR